MRAIALIAMCLLAAPSIAQGQSLAEQARRNEAFKLAKDLGRLLAAEQSCGLSYDHGAIRAWIDKRVSPSDLAFIGDLDLMTRDAIRDARAMGDAQKVATCRQAERSARALGFIR